MQSDQLFTGIMKSFFFTAFDTPTMFFRMFLSVSGMVQTLQSLFPGPATHTHRQNEITLPLLNKQKQGSLGKNLNRPKFKLGSKA